MVDRYATTLIENKADDALKSGLPARHKMIHAIFTFNPIYQREAKMALFVHRARLSVDEDGVVSQWIAAVGAV